MIWNEETIAKFNGKVFCGAGGQPMAVTNVGVVTEMSFKGEELEAFEIAGLAYGYLNEPSNPDGGAVEFPEPIPVSVTKPLKDGGTDAHILLSHLEQWLDLPKGSLPNDDGEWVTKLMDEEEEAGKRIREKGFFVRTAPMPPEKAMGNVKYGRLPFFVNVHPMPKRLTGKEGAAAWKEKLAARKAAREKAEAEAAEAVAAY